MREEQFCVLDELKDIVRNQLYKIVKECQGNEVNWRAGGTSPENYKRYYLNITLFSCFSLNLHLKTEVHYNCLKFVCINMDG